MVTANRKKRHVTVMKHGARRLFAKVHRAEKALIKALYEKGEIDRATHTRLSLDITLEKVTQPKDEAGRKPLSPSFF